MKPGQVLYTMLRACVFGMGVVFLLALPISLLLDGGVRTAEEAAYGTLALFAALSYVCPNRWGVRSAVFYLRLAVMKLAVAGVLQMGYRMVTGVYGPKRPEMYESMIPMDIAMIAAPLLLIWRRRSMRAESIAPTPAIDRTARSQMAGAIRAYMDEDITAFQFDDALSEASARTDDTTVRTIARELWFHYDDVIDHKVVASKEEWDYFNRLLLLLDSDAEMTVHSRWTWHPLQAVAALLLAAFVVVAMRVGWGGQLIATAVPFGPPSMLLAWLSARRRRKQRRHVDVALAPFPSVGALLSIRRVVPGFVKLRYPKDLVDRKIRSPFARTVLALPWSLVWCVFSPVGLFLQMLPDRDAEVRISGGGMTMALASEKKGARWS